MALDYNNFRLLAERLINENGRTLTLQREDQVNATDPAQPWRTAATTNQVTLDVLGVFIEFEKEDFDGSLVRRGDKRVLVAAKDTEDVRTGTENIEIEDFDTLLDDGEVWKIITVEVIEPGPLKVAYDIQVRK
jgi:hypothetical protein